MWVKQRYDPEHPYVVREIRPLEERPDLAMESIFIPAKMEDNPHINKEEYEATLAATSSGGKLFQAWRWGRWDVIAGAFFECWDEETMVVARPVVREWDVKWVSIDWGWKDYSVVYWQAQDENQRIVTYRELKVNKTTPDALGRLIVERNEGEKLAMVALSPDAFAERTSTKTIAEEIGKELAAGGLPAPTRADNDRKGGWMLMTQLLLSGYWRVSKACPALLQAIPLAQHDPKDTEDIEESPFDDPLDAARYGLKTFLVGTRIPKDEVVRRYVAARMGQTLKREGSAGLEERILGGRKALVDPEGNVVEMESEQVAADRWTRTARLSASGLARNRRRIRPKALPYGRRYGGF